MNDVTNADENQIERIVHEVMRRLLSMNNPAEAGRPSSVTSTVTGSGGNGSTAAAAQTLRVADRVVTMARLSGQLNGITQVEVSPGAIVTPLVVDELREQGIRLERAPAARARNPKAADAPPLVLMADAAQARRVTPLLEQLAVNWHHLPASDAADQTAELPTSGRTIVLTADWARVVCQANRRPQLRAAVVCSTATVQQACRQTDPNVLVIDATPLSDTQLHEVIRQYVRGERS
jgi:hypothetical protein